jgi:quercetin dioxygenase-like cupin family protein
MAHKIDAPTRIAAEGNKPKTIEEYFGRVNSGTAAVSIARMVAPAGWHEPGQRPAFDEYTVVLGGCLLVETEAGAIRVEAGEAILSEAGEWVRYRTADDQGAEYVAVCLPAFSAETVNRDS